MADAWIEPAGGPEQWRKFNRYKDGRPVRWICNYVDLLSDDDYLSLTAHRRAILHGLWLYFASSRARVPLKTTLIAHQLGLHRVTKDDIDALCDAGFFRVSVTKPSRERYGFVPAREGVGRDITQQSEKGPKPRTHARAREAPPAAVAGNDNGNTDYSEALSTLEALGWSTSQLTAAAADRERAAAWADAAQTLELDNPGGYAWNGFRNQGSWPNGQPPRPQPDLVTACRNTIAGHGWDETTDEQGMLDDFRRSADRLRQPLNAAIEQVMLDEWRAERARRYPPEPAESPMP